jgi:Predicted solute binding protein
MVKAKGSALTYLVLLALTALAFALPLTVSAMTNPGGANVPNGLVITYNSSTPTFTLPVVNQGYEPVEVSLTVNGQSYSLSLSPYSFQLVNASLTPGLNTVSLNKEVLKVDYVPSSSAISGPATINGSKGVVVVQNVKPGSYLYFSVSVKLPSSSYYLSPLPPVTDMEQGPQYSVGFQQMSSNTIMYAVIVPSGIAQGLYSVYFPIQIIGSVKVSNSTYALLPVGYSWAVAILNVTYGLKPFSNSNSTVSYNGGTLAQFVIPDFNSSRTYYVIAGGNVYQVGEMSASFNVYGMSSSVTYYGSDKVQVAYSSDGLLVLVPNYSGPVQLSTSPTIATSTTSTTTTSTSTTTTSTTTTTTTTSSTTTTTTTTTTSSVQTSTTSTVSTTSTTTTSTTSGVTNTTVVMVTTPTTSTTSPTTPTATSSYSLPLTEIVIGAVVVVVIIAAAVLLLRR